MEERKPEITALQGGRFRVQSILGAGGFGVTYRCEDRRRGKTCAVKEYMPDAIAHRDLKTGEVLYSPERRRAFLHGKNRFLEEAELLMRMRDVPYVVQVWEAFEENHTAYYVMEFLEGSTLKQLMRAMGGRLPYTAALEAVVKAGTALDMVHRRAGIFHRDISPENIMIMPDGSVRIIDFGSAKAMAVSENQQFSVVLKPGFAPPEQYASNMSQGSFTDVYALAGTFYFAASGKMVPSAPDRLMGESFERLDELVPECGKEAADAVERALVLDAKFRTQTMSEFLDDLTGSRSSMGMAAVPAEDEKEPEDDYGSETEIRAVPPEADAEISAGLLEPQTGEWPEEGSAECGPEPLAVHTGEPAAEAGPQTASGFGENTNVRLSQAWLVVRRGASSGRCFPLQPGQAVNVGRSPKKSSIVISGHPEISGLHFRLCWMPEKHGFYVIDESTNGLYYQGIRLEKGKKYRVLPGDELGIGSMECIITFMTGAENHDG